MEIKKLLLAFAKACGIMILVVGCLILSIYAMVEPIFGGVLVLLFVTLVLTYVIYKNKS